MRRFTAHAALLAGVSALVLYPQTVHAQGALMYASGGPAAAWNIGYRDVAWLIGGGVELLNGPLGLGGEVGRHASIAPGLRRCGLAGDEAGLRAF